MRTPKAVPVVLRGHGVGIEVLVFEHPLAGTQLVKGTVERGESVSEAAVRELAEESGIADATCLRDLGTWEECPRGQVWHFREMSVAKPPPESWTHFTADGGGLFFKCRWHLLAAPAPGSCHSVFVSALEFLKSKLLQAHLPDATTRY